MTETAMIKAIYEGMQETKGQIKDLQLTFENETNRNRREITGLKNDIKKSEESTKEYINSRFTESENMILNEVDRGQGILENQIEQVKKNIEELNQYYKIAKLENDKTTFHIGYNVTFAKSTS